MDSPLRLALLGVAAGAAGTTALNGVTYLDMAVRGRPSSSTPQKTVEEMSDKTGIPIPGDEDTEQNRVSGLGPLIGILAGLGTGALLGLGRAAGWRPGLAGSTAAATAAVLVGSNGPMTALGVTDPRTWPAKSWVVDFIPHFTYGIVTAAVLERLDP